VASKVSIPVPPGTQISIPTGATVTIQVPSQIGGYQFLSFNIDGVTVTQNPATFVMDKDKSVTANFTQVKSMVTVDLVKRTVTNDGTVNLTLTEIISKVSTLTPGQTVTLDPNTSTIKAA
jgi:hypothetical protein